MTVLFIDTNAQLPGCTCGHNCEMPCIHRVGLIEAPCCPGCPPLPYVDADHYDAAKDEAITLHDESAAA